MIAHGAADGALLLADGTSPCSCLFAAPPSSEEGGLLVLPLFAAPQAKLIARILTPERIHLRQLISYYWAGAGVPIHSAAGARRFAFVLRLG